jgi:DNA-binding SARP family transcriptional activator
VEFGILGPLVVLDDGEELPLGPAKERAVLAALLLRIGSSSRGRSWSKTCGGNRRR